MPLATPKPSGEWQAATSVQARRILGGGPATAGEKTRDPSATAETAAPAAPTVFKTARRERGGECSSLMMGLLRLFRLEFCRSAGTRCACVIASGAKQSKDRDLQELSARLCYGDRPHRPFGVGGAEDSPRLTHNPANVTIAGLLRSARNDGWRSH